jgi:hypothetical protein
MLHPFLQLEICSEPNVYGVLAEALLHAVSASLVGIDRTNGGMHTIRPCRRPVGPLSASLLMRLR